VKASQMLNDVALGEVHFYENAKQELRAARKLPKKTADEKAIRSDAIKCARVKKESASLFRKLGADNITPPDEAYKEALLNRSSNGFIDSLRTKQELRRYLKKESMYRRITKPYTDAQNYLEQKNYYTHYNELEARYHELVAVEQ
ncbi:MAG: hypothetical protein IJE63_01350, partial [Clostridia bacterium]|nr:hypothetical protein [Clostridia bacterium]